MDIEQYNFENIQKEIEGSPDGVGYDIALSRTYDEIKEAKFEEDDTVSFGVWERDLKKADWQKALHLCLNALETQSKDLQIVGWLMESLATLEGFEGILKSIEILDEFINKFWNTCYPRNEDNSSDEEQKIRILNWIYNTIEKISRFIPFIENDTNISIYAYDYAVEMKNTIIRDPNSSTDVLNSAKKMNMKTLEELQNIINTSDSSYLEQTKSIITSIKTACAKLKETTSKFISAPEIPFSDLLNNLEKVKKIISLKNKEIPEKPKQSDIQIIQTSERDSIYDEINNLAQRLAIIEKHSPSSYILNLVVSWKNKSLLEIIDDIKTGTSESHKLLKFLVN